MTEEEKKQQEQAVSVAEANAQRSEANAPATAGTPETPAAPQPDTNTPAAPQPGAKAKYMDTYRAAYPDMDMDDEEAVYGQANSNYEELMNHRATQKQLADSLEKHPELNDMVVMASRGQNPWVWVAENLGMDMRDMANDPEFVDSITEALAKFHQAEADKAEAAAKSAQDDEDYKAQVTEAMSQSMQTLGEIQKEKGLSDEECEQIFTDFFKQIDEAKEGRVSKDLWQAYINSRNYDGDMEKARNEAAAKALNEKFQNRVKTPDNDVPPSMPQGSGRSGGGRKGFFSGVD